MDVKIEHIAQNLSPRIWLVSHPSPSPPEINVGIDANVASRRYSSASWPNRLGHAAGIVNSNIDFGGRGGKQDRGAAIMIISTHTAAKGRVSIT